MICSNCKMRWADFPEEDFTSDSEGTHPKNKEAEKRRVVKFDSNEIQYCGCIERDNEIKFGTLHENGTLSNVRLIKQTDIGKCPFYIFSPDHYREDGTCKCSNAEHRAMMIKEWGYRKSQFKNIPLVD